LEVHAPEISHRRGLSREYSIAFNSPLSVVFLGRLQKTNPTRYGEWMPLTVQEQFGQIDIYVFDQILRGNITHEMRVLDAGCGYGRNLVHLLRQGCEVFALDEDRDAINHVRKLSVSLETGLPAQNFQVGEIEQMPFPTPSPMSCSAIPCFTSPAMKLISQKCCRSYGVF